MKKQVPSAIPLKIHQCLICFRQYGSVLIYLYRTCAVAEDNFLLEVFGVTSDSIVEGAPRTEKPAPNAWDDDTLTPTAKKLVTVVTEAFDKWATSTLRLLRLLSPEAGLREVQAPTEELTFRRIFPEVRRGRRIFKDENTIALMQLVTR